MPVHERVRYAHVNLMSLYEANFAKFVTLVPFDGDNVFVLNNDQCAMELHFRVIDRAPYTMTWHITSRYPGMPAGMPNPHFIVRLYSDAKLLEVLQYQGRGRFQGEYPFPNQWMFARDEKRQVNGFFGELLGYCVVNGYQPAEMK